MKSTRWQYINTQRSSFATSYLRSMFLPINYPQSVHKCYLPFHIWQALETYVGGFVGVLCSQAMLESLGVSSTVASTAGAVAIQWVLKDGIAEMGKLLFIKRYARSFDSHPKTWKAVGETLTTLGSGLQLCTLLVPGTYFLAFAATGNILKSVSWAVWGVTHTWFIRNFANANNVGDLTAKAEAQSAFALISGWLSGVALLSYSHTATTLFSVYFLLAPLHGLATYQLLGNAEVGSLNDAKARVLVSAFVQRNFVLSVGHSTLDRYVGVLGESVRKSPKPSKKEPLKLPEMKLGSSIEEAFGTLDDVRECIETIRNEDFLIGIKHEQDRRVFHIVMHRDAEGHDSLKAMLNAAKLDELLDVTDSISSSAPTHPTEQMNPTHASYQDLRMRTLLKEAHEWTLANFPHFVAQLDENDWQTESVLFDDPGCRAIWNKLPRPDGAALASIEVPPESPIPR